MLSDLWMAAYSQYTCVGLRVCACALCSAVLHCVQYVSFECVLYVHMHGNEYHTSLCSCFC